MDLFVPIAAIVFILVVPAGEFIPPRSLQICDEGDPQGLIQYIKQHRNDSNVSIGQPPSGGSRNLARPAGGKRTHLCRDVSLSSD